MDLLNSHGVHLRSEQPEKKIVKLDMSTIYDCISGLNYIHKLRTICIPYSKLSMVSSFYLDGFNFIFTVFSPFDCLLSISKRRDNTSILSGIEKIQHSRIKCTQYAHA